MRLNYDEVDLRSLERPHSRVVRFTLGAPIATFITPELPTPELGLQFFPVGKDTARISIAIDDLIVREQLLRPGGKPPSYLIDRFLQNPSGVQILPVQFGPEDTQLLYPGDFEIKYLAPNPGGFGLLVSCPRELKLIYHSKRGVNLTTLLTQPY